jgi:hypothetical protein
MKKSILYPISVLAFVIILAAVTFIYVKSLATASRSMTFPPNDCISYRMRLPGNQLRQLKVKNGLLRIVGSQFIAFERDGVRVESSLEQPDYGKVSDLRLAANGDAYVIGQQRTYKVLLAPAADRVALHTEALPVLYRKPCGFLWQMVGGCQEERAIFSDAVSAVFLSGYDSRGSFKSYVYGLTGTVLDLSKEAAPNYQSDCGIGLVRMVGHSEAAIMDKSGNLKPYKR